MGRSPGSDELPDIDALLREEGPRVEWKESVADVHGVVQTLSAFANDYGREGGGWVICGIKEQRDAHGFSEARKVGLTANRYQELRKKVAHWCHEYVKPAINPKTHDEPAEEDPGRRLLVFWMAASKHVHFLKDKLWYRADSHTRQAPPEVIAALMRDKGESPPFLEEACVRATLADLDRGLLDEILKPLGLPRASDAYLEPDVTIDARTPPLVRKDPSSGQPIPTRLGVLLACREPERFLRGATAILAVYAGTSKSGGHSQRFDLSGPLPRLIEDVLARLQAHVGYDVDKSDFVAGGKQNRPRYGIRAIREAVVNAFVHRDYASDDPVRIDVFADRIEIWSPGGLVRGLEQADLADAVVQPSWRNGSLVSIVVFGLGLAENLGQGLRTIIDETMEVAGKPPELKSDHRSFTVILPAFRPLLSPVQMPPAAAGMAGREGILLISIGGSSIRATAEHSFGKLALSPDDVLVDLAVDYIEPHSPEWTEQARYIRDHVARWVEDPAYSRFHLFYRGPVVMAPLIGALVVPVKPLVLYHFENGRYFSAYTLDRRFLHGARRSPGTA